jgi:hypothetical protein
LSVARSPSIIADEVFSERKVLAARIGAGFPAMTSFLSVTGDAARKSGWWAVEADSDSNRPFVVSLVYQLGGDSSGQIGISVGRGMRVCFPARSFTLQAGNLDPAQNTVSCRATRVPAPVQTQNSVVLVSTIGGSGVATVDVPAMARTARFEVGDPAAKPGTTIELVDAVLGVVSHHTFAEQPPEGVIIGDAKQIRCSAPAGTKCRLVLGLHL